MNEETYVFFGLVTVLGECTFELQCLLNRMKIRSEFIYDDEIVFVVF